MLLWHHFIFLLSLLTEVPGSGPLKDGLNGEKAGCRITRIVSWIGSQSSKILPREGCKKLYLLKFRDIICTFANEKVWTSNLHPWSGFFINCQPSQFKLVKMVLSRNHFPSNKINHLTAPVRSLCHRSWRRAVAVSPSVCPKTAFLVKFQTSLL